MKNNFKNISMALMVMSVVFTSCKKEEFAMRELKTPNNIILTTNIEDASADNPAGLGSGNVTISVTAADVLSYKVDYGDGSNTDIVPTGNITHKYTKLGENDYIISVSALGTGGITSTVSKKITVKYIYELKPEIITALTGDASKVWVSDHDADAHFGVGPAGTFTPDYYAASPNSRAACSYDDEITFTKVSGSNISISVDNKGQSFYIGAASSYYGNSGGDACGTVATGGTQSLSFSEAASSSTPANSTRVQFTVPGKGILIFGTGANTYEILSITANKMNVRNIGIDGNAWYQKFKIK